MVGQEKQHQSGRSRTSARRSRLVARGPVSLQPVPLVNISDYLARRRAAAGHVTRRMLTHLSLSVMVVDEIGYLPTSRTSAKLFFHLMRRRYTHASSVLTSNKSYEEWGDISRRRSDGRRSHRPALTPRLHRQHSRQQLADSGSVGRSPHASPGRPRWSPPAPPYVAAPPDVRRPLRTRLIPRPECAILVAESALFLLVLTVR